MEKSYFLDIVGDSSTMRVLQFLIEGRHFDYSLTDIAENAGVSWGTLHTVFPRLIKHKVVVNTRDIGRAKLYKINQENKFAKILIELYDATITKLLATFKEKELLA